MLNLELHWKSHPTDKESIIGICPELPDSFCYFYIMRMAHEKFWVAMPSYGTDYVYKRLILHSSREKLSKLYMQLIEFE
jgi:hypothetical protein